MYSSLKLVPLPVKVFWLFFLLVTILSFMDVWSVSVSYGALLWHYLQNEYMGCNIEK